LSNDNTVKLIDFGNATRLTDATGHNSSSVGSPAFMAPELLKKGRIFLHRSFAFCALY
jgi:serine/threonine protein kinase